MSMKHAFHAAILAILLGMSAPQTQAQVVSGGFVSFGNPWMGGGFGNPWMGGGFVTPMVAPTPILAPAAVSPYMVAPAPLVVAPPMVVGPTVPVGWGLGPRFVGPRVYGPRGFVTPYRRGYVRRW